MTDARTDTSSDQPLIVQGDFTVLLEVASARFRAAREALIAFAELVKSPEHFHTYRITPLSLWNARAAGMESGRILQTLEGFARYPTPGSPPRACSSASSPATRSPSSSTSGIVRAPNTSCRRRSSSFLPSSTTSRYGMPARSSSSFARVQKEQLDQV